MYDEVRTTEDYLYPGKNALETALILSTDVARLFRSAGRTYSMLEALKDVIQKLDEERIPFALVGGLAVCHHGIPRATKDADFMVNEEDADRVRCLFASDYLGGMKDFMKFLHGGTRLDILSTRLRFHREALAKAEECEVEGIRIRVIPVRGLVTMKLIAAAERTDRAAAARDLVDVLEIVQHSKTITAEDLRAAVKTISDAYGSFGPHGFEKYRRVFTRLNEGLEEMGRGDMKVPVP